MMNVRNGKIEKRLTDSFLVVALMTAAAAVLVTIMLLIVSNRYTFALNYYGFAQGDIGNAMTDLSEARSATRAIIGYDDPEVVEGVIRQREDALNRFDEAYAKMQETIVSDMVQQKYDDVSALIEQYKELDNQIVELGKTQNEEDSKEAQRIAYEELTPIYNEIYDTMEGMLDDKIALGDGTDRKLNVLGWISVCVSIVVIVAVCYIAVRLGKRIAKQISSALESVGKRLEEFADGDLSSAFPEFDTEDEISTMATEAKEMAENLRVMILDLEKELGEVAARNFVSESSCPERYVGEFQTINESLVSLRSEMRDVLKEINSVSTQVDSGSVQLAESATALAEGATDQAASVQELTAAITDLTAKNEDSAKKAEQAYREGLTYEAHSEKGKMEMDSLERAMEQIGKASEEIEGIITEIEDIASQTNLLSLNASIEAARAGEAGKGFAVVAEQIGKLATDSSQSAIRTKELIRNALNQIEAGSEATERTKETFEEIIRGINFLSDVLRESSENSITQANTMKEIQSNVESISGIIQNNAAYAEETSATGEELAAQATTLNELIQRFVLEKEG